MKALFVRIRVEQRFIHAPMSIGIEAFLFVLMLKKIAQKGENLWKTAKKQWKKW